MAAATRRRKTPPRHTNAMELTVVIHNAAEGGYWAEIPGMPGCVSEGDTLDEIQANIREAAEGWLEAAENKGWLEADKNAALSEIQANIREAAEAAERSLKEKSAEFLPASREI